MNTKIIVSGGALALALLVTGCESDGGIAARGKEKAGVYAALKPWEKRYVDAGTVAVGFTPDMVYIALGKPDRIESKDLPEGHVDLWTYDRAYPDMSTIHGFQSAKFSPDSVFQPLPATTQTVAGGNSAAIGGSAIPRGMDRGGGESLAKTGGPQGGSMEPAAPESFTIQVLFQNGKAARMAAVPNMN